MVDIVKSGDLFVAIDDNGNQIASSKNKYYLKQKVSSLKPQPKKRESSFSINQRFTFVEQIVTMIASKQIVSVVITGEGGLGKTHTVISSLNQSNLTDITPYLADLDDNSVVDRTGKYVTIKGFSTAKGLYKTLYNNRDSIIVFDDCDSILKDLDALNLLKGALDSYDDRYISWNTNNTDDSLPSTFKFTGSVIFISNLTQDRINQALRTRSLCIDLSMTTEQKLDRMTYIISQPDFLPAIDFNAKKDALQLISTHRDIANEISLRTLINISKIRNSNNNNWQQLALYILEN